MIKKAIKKAEKAIQMYFAITVTILTIIICFLFYLSLSVHSTYTVYIPNGTSTQIISYLEDKGFDVNRFDTFIMSIFGKPQAGWISVGDTKLTKADFLYKITHSKAVLREITLIPGESKEIFFNRLSKDLNLSYEKLNLYYNEIATYKDGTIIPDTYFMPIDMDEKHLIYYLLGLSMQKYKELSLSIFGNFQENKWFRYITIASLIQKESYDKSEFALVSSVIHNRLSKGMRLQMDGSLKYAMRSNQKITKSIIESDNSEYNTYKIYGLPKDPISSVSLDAIKAAIFPANTTYLYFVSKNGNKHTFSSTYKEHLKNIHKK